MEPADAASTSASYEAALEQHRRGTYALRLFVAGSSPASLRAVANLRRICEEHLPGRYELEVVDVLQDPAGASSEQIVAIPTLVRVEPRPPRRLVGDLADVPRVLRGLELIS